MGNRQVGMEVEVQQVLQRTLQQLFVQLRTVQRPVGHVQENNRRYRLKCAGPPQ